MQMTKMPSQMLCQSFCLLQNQVLQHMDMIQCSMMMDSDEHVGLEDAESGFHEKDTSQGKRPLQGGEFSDFVSVVFLTRSSTSHDYNGIDTLMSIRMSKLEFFCSRPTLVALDF